MAFGDRSRLDNQQAPQHCLSLPPLNWIVQPMLPCPAFECEFLGSIQVLVVARRVLYCLTYLFSTDIWSLKFENLDPTPTGQSVTLQGGQSLDLQTRKWPELTC